MYLRGLRNLGIQTESWLIRPWIWWCPQTSREDLLSFPKTDFSSWVGDLSWFPDRLTFGLKVPVLHFTQYCVFIFFELDMVFCILKHSAKTHNVQTFRDSDTIKHSEWGIMCEKITSCHWIHLKANLNYWNQQHNHKQLKTLAIDCLPLLHHRLQGHFTDFWVPTLVMSVWNRLADISNYTCCSLYKCEFACKHCSSR